MMAEGLILLLDAYKQLLATGVSAGSLLFLTYIHALDLNAEGMIHKIADEMKISCIIGCEKDSHRRHG